MKKFRVICSHIGLGVASLVTMVSCVMWELTLVFNGYVFFQIFSYVICGVKFRFMCQKTLNCSHIKSNGIFFV